MARFRRRYTLIDHEDANTREVGLVFVLHPAKNPADLAALHTLIENVEPELAADLRQFVEMIESHPQRQLGDYGEKCLPHITHPKVIEFAKQRLTKETS